MSGPSLVYVGAGVSFVGLLYFVSPLCKCDAVLDILYNCVASFVCFALFCVWVTAIQESPKLVEMIRNKPYNYFWCFESYENM